jgi:hypothetical protein
MGRTAFSMRGRRWRSIEMLTIRRWRRWSMAIHEFIWRRVVK